MNTSSAGMQFVWNFGMAALLACGSTVAAHAQVIKMGGEFQVNTYTTGPQENPRVGTDASGNFVVVWTSDGADGSADAAAVQRYDSIGRPLGTEFFANTYTTGTQGVPHIAVQPNGNFVVVWQGEGGQDAGTTSGIFGQRFSSTGAKVGTEFQVNTYTTGSQENPSVAVNPAGDFVVVWEGNTQIDVHGIAGRRFNSSGAALGSEFAVNTYTTDEQEKADVALDAAGNFTVVWESHRFDDAADPMHAGVAAQRYDNTGAPVGTEFLVNTYTTDDQEHAAIAMDAAGNFVVVWDSYGQDGSEEGIFGQRYDSSGAKVGTEFIANTYTTDEQEDPGLAVDSAGNFVVVWYSNPQDGSGDGAFGQRFSSTGARLGTEFQINTYTTGGQTDPKVAAQPGGGFVVVWQGSQDGSSDSINAQRFGPIPTAPVLSWGPLTGLIVMLAWLGVLSVRRRGIT